MVNAPSVTFSSWHFWRKYANGLKRETISRNNITKRYHKTLSQNATSNGGDASRVGHYSIGSYTNKGSQTAIITRLSVSLCLEFRRGTRRPH